ncbi:MAG: 6-phosphogluconolactonase [Opitutales bacterium]
MTYVDTPSGRLLVGDRETLFKAKADAVVAAARRAAEHPGGPVVALTGGSTPKAWYPWVVETGALPEDVVEVLTWTVSDERHVPLNNPDSNFGTAQHLLLDPLDVPARRRLPWPTDHEAPEAASLYARYFQTRFGRERCYDLCILGMGEDGHTASLFPGSPLIGSPEEAETPFSALQIPDKGWRLTINESGLNRCSRILQIVTGANKAEMLKRVLEGPFDPHRLPSQLLRNFRDRVTILADEDAASLLGA